MQMKHRGNTVFSSLILYPQITKQRKKKDDGTYSFHFSKCRTKKLALKLGVMSCHCHWNRIGTQRDSQCNVDCN